MREEQKVDCQGMCVSETVEFSVVDDHISQSRQSNATSERVVGVERYLSSSSWSHDHDTEFTHLDCGCGFVEIPSQQLGMIRSFVGNLVRIGTLFVGAVGRVNRSGRTCSFWNFFSGPTPGRHVAVLLYRCTSVRSYVPSLPRHDLSLIGGQDP